MLSRSKSRSGFLDFGRKSQKSAISRTISASKFCRGDPLVPQIDASAHKPLDRNNSHGTSPSEAMNQLLEELKMTRALLEVSEQEKERALDSLRELKLEIEISRQTDSSLAEKDALIDGLEVELSIFKASRSVLTESLSQSKKKIKELEMEIEKSRVSELENPKLDHALLLEKLERLDNHESSSPKEKELKEATDAKEMLELKEMELENVKQVAERNADLLTEAKIENEQLKKTIERLRLEACESLLAWNEREIGFVKCVKEAEDDRVRLQQENIRLKESLKSASSTIDMFREENLKLKAVIKQATGIAKIEKSFQLNRTQSAREENLDFLTRESRKLSVKELNRPLIVASMKDPKSETKKQGAKNKSMKAMFDESKKVKLQKNRLSFDLSELKKANTKEDGEIPIKAEILTGSVFDDVDAPRLHTRRVSFSFSNDKTDSSEDLDRQEVSDFDDSRNSWIWKRRAFLQSFEDLIKGRSVEKEE